MAQQARDEAGNIWNVDDQGNVISLAQAAPSAGGVIGPDPLDVEKDRLEAARLREQVNNITQNAPLDRAIKEQQLRDAQNPRSAPPVGYRYKSDGSLEVIPGAPRPKGANSGLLDALVGQVNEANRIYGQNFAPTKGVAGLSDYIPSMLSDNASAFDVSANQLEDLAAQAFKLPGAGAQSDADAARIAAANKPSRWFRDAGNEQLFRGLRQRIDNIRAAQGLPPAQWTFDENGRPIQQRDEAMLASGGGGGGSNPPTPPGYNGPAGYDVAGVTPGSPGGGGGFANAAGVAMAGKLAQAYNQGATLPQLNSLLTENGFQPFTDPKAIEQIQRRGPLNFAPPVMDDTRGTVGRAIGNAADSATGAYFINAGDALTAGNLDTLAGGPTNLAMDYSRQQYPGASLLGSVTGGALAAGGAELGLARAGLTAGRAALGGDALYGAAYGAGSTDEGNRLLGAAAGGTGGLLGGIAGRAAARGIGGALTGVRNADVQYLRDREIPLTAGRVLSQSGPVGRAIASTEERLAGTPFIGDVIGSRWQEGRRAVNETAFNDAAAPMAQQTTPLNVQIGEVGPQGIEALRAARTTAYDNAVNGRMASVDPQYQAQYGNALTMANALPNTGPQVAAEIDAAVPGYFANGIINGPNAQAAIRELQGIRRGRQQDPLAHRTGQAVREAEGALRGLFDRQAPGFTNDLARANEVQTNLKTLEAAVSAAKNQPDNLFTAAQLNTASTQSANRLTGNGATTNRPFFRLAEAAQNVLPSRTPDSGTAGRLALLALPSALGGAGGYAVGGGEGAATGGLAAAGLLLAGGTRGAQRAITSALADRPDALIQLGNEVQRRARYGGIFGAPLLAGGMTALVPQ